MILLFCGKNQFVFNIGWYFEEDIIRNYYTESIIQNIAREIERLINQEIITEKTMIFTRYIILGL